jgi:hypothetical protein
MKWFQTDHDQAIAVVRGFMTCHGSIKQKIEKEINHGI